MVFLNVREVSVLAYLGDVVTREVWSMSLIMNKFLTWWRPGLSVPGLTRRGCEFKAWRRTSQRRS